ncbi:MAG: right-handed parallel beta-helix repeat-containing protein [Syntrophobacteraceae bacterium]
MTYIACVIVAMFFATGAFAADACRDALPPVLKGNITLPAGCVFDKPITITHSDTSLNCSGSIFDGQHKHTFGLFIDSEGKPLSNVKVDNCTFRNFKRTGVRITWSEADTRKGSNRKEIYSRTPNNISLKRITVEGSGGVGFYIDDYVTDVTLQDSVIKDSGGVGLYLEHSSRNSRILNNVFLRNGFGSSFKRHHREAIAVDSSANNVIEGNVFEGNHAGGVFLYKNCGEHFSEGKNVIRWQHSENNQIRNNRFKNEKVGVWIASRQSLNLARTDCGDPPMIAGKKFYEDFANKNIVSDNHFCGCEVAIRVEGDENRISNNQFDKATRVRVDFPLTKREELLKRPPRGNIVTGGRVADCGR